MKAFDNEDIVIVTEPSERYTEERIPTSCFIKLPRGSEIAKDGIRIQREHKKILDSFRLKYDNLLKEKDKLKIMFDTNVKLHEERITKYKWIIGTSSLLFVGTSIFLIAK